MTTKTEQLDALLAALLAKAREAGCADVHAAAAEKRADLAHPSLRAKLRRAARQERHLCECAQAALTRARLRFMEHALGLSLGELHE